MTRFALACAAAAATLLAGCAAAEPAPEPADRISAADLQADFRDLYAGLARAHHGLYAHTPRAEMDALYAETLATLDRPMTQHEASVVFQEFVAAGHVAHARIDDQWTAVETYATDGGRFFPLVVRIKDGRVFVAGDRSGTDALAPGDELLALDGAPMDVWRGRLGAHISADTVYLRDSIMERDFADLLWLDAGASDAFNIDVRGADGATRTATLPARTRDEIAAAAAAAPPTLDIDVTERKAEVLADGTAYLRPGIFINLEPDADLYDAASFHAFIDAAFAEFIDAGATRLLIDLRDNPGGDSSFSDRMIAWFADAPFQFAKAVRIKVSPEAVAANAARLDAGSPDPVSPVYADLYAGADMGDIVEFPIAATPPRDGARFEGEVYALVNRRSYSNTVAVAATLQDYGFGTILGEATSDLATTYGAMETFTLPRTGFTVGFPKAFILRPNGDETVGGVTPDIVIDTPIVEGEDDPVLAEALRIATER